DEEAVEDAEALGERVVVGRRVAAEVQERRVAVGLAEVAEQLVVGAVLLDDVDDVLERRVAAAALGGTGAVPAIRGYDALREARELRAVRHGDDLERAGDLAQRGVRRRALVLERDDRLRAVGVRGGAAPLAVRGGE